MSLLGKSPEAVAVMMFFPSALPGVEAVRLRRAIKVCANIIDILGTRHSQIQADLDSADPSPSSHLPRIVPPRPKKVKRCKPPLFPPTAAQLESVRAASSESIEELAPAIDPDTVDDEDAWGEWSAKDEGPAPSKKVTEFSSASSWEPWEDSQAVKKAKTSQCGMNRSWSNSSSRRTWSSW
jgi:hypothetical protein